MKTGIFRGGCLTGPQHSGVEMHGFLNYLVKVAVQEGSYTIFGYKGKQVRDQIHSLDAIDCFGSSFKTQNQVKCITWVVGEIIQPA